MSVFTKLYFVVALVSFLLVVFTLRKAKPLHTFTAMFFVLHTLVAEHPIIHMIWQLGLTLLALSLGTLDTSLGQYGLALFMLSWLGKLFLLTQSAAAGSVLHQALLKGLGSDYRQRIPADRLAVLNQAVTADHLLKPFSFKRDNVTVQKDICYGDEKYGNRNLLDIYSTTQTTNTPRPVLLSVHGGGWIMGTKGHDAQPLLHHMASLGWVCVAINYRLSPKATFPEHIIDVKRAIMWVKQNIHEYGGDPEFVAIVGGSAGGHLSSLAVVSANKKEWQPGFESVDTSLQAGVHNYGVYSFVSEGAESFVKQSEKLFTRHIFKQSRQDNPLLWEQASPDSYINAALGKTLPPMFFIHGSHDTTVPPDFSRQFFERLKDAKHRALVYAELPYAKHGYDVTQSLRGGQALDAVAEFLEWSYARYKNQVVADSSIESIPSNNS
ncbi:alpha/beta hydrolase [Pseudomaricurvus alcaniphilus]|uniref:alpha/beta hydrolase n=1 Tax=Pseudomaricurvus alcaniphilus TaxID=1166482 RepID=UPI00140C6C64|nr:alpha/beta hydrolase [Pseudomaricurvus alcaniphilus]NHN36551.1 alpha/beta hydrolase [Pseudomaricurvus alcaniphilus]